MSFAESVKVAMAAVTPKISFEFFPPNAPSGAMRLWSSVERLAPLGPSFVSVTYGAGGGTRDRTMAAIMAIRDRVRLDVAGHLTCVGASKAETMEVAATYAKLGCRRIVALRGDAPEGAGAFQPHPEGFASAPELVAALAETGNFEISVGAYPEPHPEAATPEDDIEALKRKIDAGASEAITQFFFDNATYFRFLDRCEKAGIDAPIIPGVLPVENFGKMKRFAGRCGANVPDWMEKAFGNAQTDAEAELLSISICAEQSNELLEQGAPRIHLYTLNNPDIPYQVCRALGIEPVAMSVAAEGGCA